MGWNGWPFLAALPRGVGPLSSGDRCKLLGEVLPPAIGQEMQWELSAKVFGAKSQRGAKLVWSHEWRHISERPQWWAEGVPESRFLESPRTHHASPGRAHKPFGCDRCEKAH